MPGAINLEAVNNMLAALEVRVTVIEGEVERVLNELVVYLKEHAFRDISEHVKL